MGKAIRKEKKYIGESSGTLGRTTKTELNNALRKLGKSTPRKDTICYSVLENLSDKGKIVLLNVYNKIWQDGIIPRA